MLPVAQASGSQSRRHLPNASPAGPVELARLLLERTHTLTDNTAALVALTSGIVSTYVTNNRANPDELPALIQSVHAALKAIDAPEPEPSEEVAKPTAAQVRRSVTDKGLVSFLDGKTYQSLTRHLKGQGLTPAAYREQFGLQDDYPMVAPAYSARRSVIAKSLGLGRKRHADEKTHAPKTRKPRAPKTS